MNLPRVFLFLCPVFMLLFSQSILSSNTTTYTLQPEPGFNDGLDNGDALNGMDVWISKRNPDDNFAGYDQFYTAWNDGDGCYNDNSAYAGLIRFDVAGSELPEVATSAKLRLYALTALVSPNGALDTEVFQLQSDWSETSATWNNRPLRGPLAASVSIPDGVLGWYEWDITSLYNDWKSGASPNYGLEIYTFTCVGNVSHVRSFYSSDTLMKIFDPCSWSRVSMMSQ